MEIRISGTPEEIAGLVNTRKDQQRPELVLMRKPYSMEYALVDISELLGAKGQARVYGLSRTEILKP